MVLGVSFLGWTAISFGLILAGLFGLVFCALRAGGLDQGYPVHPVQRPVPDLDDWLAEDEIDWSEIKIWKRPEAEALALGGGLGVRREIKIERARRLREEGWTYRAIGDRYGVTPKTVWRWLGHARPRQSDQERDAFLDQVLQAKTLRAEGSTYKDIATQIGVSRRAAITRCNAAVLDLTCAVCASKFVATDSKRVYCSDFCAAKGDRERKRRCEETTGRATCTDCGAALGAGSKWAGVERCEMCHQCSEAERVDERARRIEQWWSEGLSMSEICECLGWTHNHLCTEMVRLREKGYDLPYRYSLNGNAKFPEQVAV